MVFVLILGLGFTGCDGITKISPPATVNTDGDFYKCYCYGSDTATGMGTRIIDKKKGGGTWFMYNRFEDGEDGDGDYGKWDYKNPDRDDDDIYVYKIVAGNPKNGKNYIGTYWVWPMADNMYRVGYWINAKFEVVEEHLGISDNPDFTAKPGKDDNQDFGEGNEFYDADGKFYIFAHFAVECAD